MTAIDTLRHNRDVTAAALARFREHHDLCMSSGFFSRELVLEMDKYAVDFRTLGLNSVTVAEVVANQWIESVIVFYENISILDKAGMVEMLKTLGGQAKELNLIFKVISEWSKKLGGHLHQVCLDTTHEAQDFVAKYQEEVDQARKIVRDAQSKFNAAHAQFLKAQKVEHDWAIAQMAISWNIFGLITTAIGHAIAQKALDSARAKENAADDVLHEAESSFSAAESREQRAEVCFL